mmetsp:Transcript_18961/g.44165  ORF Transcript_18961/g.44165 Transcript_18961/m.44165 type:complete len:281 (-) Transcript_18961:129-971(-)
MFNLVILLIHFMFILHGVLPLSFWLSFSLHQLVVCQLRLSELFALHTLRLIMDPCGLMHLRFNLDVLISSHLRSTWKLLNLVNFRLVLKDLVLFLLEMHLQLLLSLTFLRPDRELFVLFRFRVDLQLRSRIQGTARCLMRWRRLRSSLSHVILDHSAHDTCFVISLQFEQWSASKWSVSSSLITLLFRDILLRSTQARAVLSSKAGLQLGICSFCCCSDICCTLLPKSHLLIDFTAHPTQSWVSAGCNRTLQILDLMPKHPLNSLEMGFCDIRECTCLHH